MFIAVGCGTGSEDGDGDVGDTTADLTNSGGSCDRNSILSAVSGPRRTALDRGLDWFDQKVPYSQSKSHEGYRTDCSGFVSWCWQLGTSFTTADFITGGGDDSLLSSYDDLIPGDAVVRRSGGEGHVILFAGWQDSKHANACVIEQESTALGMQFHTRPAAALHASGFKPIRAKSLPDTGDTGADRGADAPLTPIPSPTSEPTPEPTPAPTPTSSGGARCVNDGMCNPGRDGSGLICSAGHCIPGCHSDAQCPGVTRCSSGQCR